MCVKLHSECVKLHTVCEITQCAQNYTYSIGKNSSHLKFLHWRRGQRGWLISAMAIAMLHFSVFWTFLVGQLTVTTNSRPSRLLSCQFLAIFRTSLTILTTSWQYLLLIIPGSLKQFKIQIKISNAIYFYQILSWGSDLKDLQSTSSALTGHCQLDAARILTFDENQERKWCISENVFSHIIYLHVFFLVQFLKKKIPSEMEVAPRYNCWNCWHYWHCWHCSTLLTWRIMSIYFIHICLVPIFQ